MSDWLFAGLVFGHVALRFYAKAHKARQRPRGDIHRPELLGRLVAWYLIFCAGAVAEKSLHLWPTPLGLKMIGFSFYILAAFLQWRAFQDLGASYSPEIEVRKEQRLVDHGLYGLVRHPLLSSLILELAGVLLFFSAYASMLLTASIFIPIVLERMREEEKILVGHFGEAYQNYRQRVGALFPRLGFHQHPQEG